MNDFFTIVTFFHSYHRYTPNILKHTHRYRHRHKISEQRDCISFYEAGGGLTADDVFLVALLTSANTQRNQSIDKQNKRKWSGVVLACVSRKYMWRILRPSCVSWMDSLRTWTPRRKRFLGCTLHANLMKVKLYIHSAVVIGPDITSGDFRKRSLTPASFYSNQIRNEKSWVMSCRDESHWV